MKTLFKICFVLGLCGCSGLKVVDSNENAGTKAVDVSGGNLKLVDTYTCKIVASNGQRVSAVGKTENEARNEAIARCRDKTLISVCSYKNVTCVKN